MTKLVHTNNFCVVVFTNAKDYFFAKICISSIRYYYPEVEIFLVKDILNGPFNTYLLRKKFKVKLLKLNQKRFGWGSSKIHFLIEDKIVGKKILMLDADIIFLGKVLDNFKGNDSDFVVVPEHLKPPFEKIQERYYLNPEDGESIFNEYKYPGYFFNTGQILITPGKIPKELFLPVFNPSKYPYFLRTDIFHTVDQSILNLILPVGINRNLFSVAQIPFMVWSVKYFAVQEKDNPEKYCKNGVPLLIHYCGDVRNYKFHEMKGENTLFFFKNNLLKNYNYFERLIDKINTKIVSNQRYNTYFKNIYERFLRK